MEIHNLIFEGGGVKGVAYAGALKALNERGKCANLKRVAGASAGSMTALMLALGINQEQIFHEILDLDFSKFLDDSLGIIRDTYRLVDNFGWHKGKALQRWVDEIVWKYTEKKHLTFQGLYDLQQGPSLYVIVTNLTMGTIEVYSHETTPDFPLSIAVRASMGIPFFFEAVSIDGQCLIDGGILNNYPIRLFDQARYLYGGRSTRRRLNRNTVGIRLGRDRKKALTPRKIKGIGEFISSLVETLLDMQELRHSSESDWSRTIQIPTLHYSSTDFGIKEPDKLILIELGYLATMEYLAQVFTD